MSQLILHRNLGNTYRKYTCWKRWNDQKNSPLFPGKSFKEFLRVQRHPSVIYRLGAVRMKAEVTTAAAFLSRLIIKLNCQLNNQQMMRLRKHLNDILTAKFRRHWYEDQPWKGQAYRCIRLNQTYRQDPVLSRAAQLAGIPYQELKLPLELTLWIDPKEVCCRFGESRGSIFTIASFKGDKKRHIDQSQSLLKQVEDGRIQHVIENGEKNFQPNKSRYCGS